MTVAAIRAAFFAALDTIPHLHVSEYVTERINPPQAMVDFRRDFGTAMAAGADTDVWSVWVYVNRTSDRAGAEFLDQMRDTDYRYSVPNVVEASSSLSVHALSCSDINVVAAGGVEYFAVQFEFEVFS